MMIDDATTFLREIDPKSALENDRVIHENPGIHPVRHDLVVALLKILETDAAFSNHQRWMTHFIFNGNSLSASTLVSSLIRRVIDGVDPERSLSDVQDLIHSEEVNHTHGVGISGIRVDKELDLGDGFKLVPRDLLSPTFFRQTIAGLMADGSENTNFKIDGPAFCAVIFSKKRRFCYRMGESAQHDQAKLQELFERKLETLFSTSAIFSIGACQFRAHTYMIDHPALAPFGSQNISSGANRINRLCETPNVINADDFFPVFQAADKLNEADYKRLSLSADFIRASRSTNSSPLVRRAIDLGTAFEILLTPDQGTELSYRLSLRGSIAFGGNITDRLNNLKLLREFYKLRSSAVHDGKFSKKYDWQRDDEKYYAAIGNIDRLYRQISLNLLMSGKIEREWHEETLSGNL